MQVSSLITCYPGSPVSEPTLSAVCCCCRHDCAHRRTRGHDHRRRGRWRSHSGVLQPARRRPTQLSRLRVPRGIYRDTVIRRVTDVPVVGHPLRLQVRVPRYRCGQYRPVTEKCSPTTPIAWPHVAAVCPLHLSPGDDRPRHRCHGGPGVGPVVGHRQHDRHGRHPDRSWPPTPPGWTGCVSPASMSTAGRMCVVAVRTGMSPSSSIFTPVLEGTGSARLLDLVPGRSAAALKTWLAGRGTRHSATASRSWPWTDSAATKPRPPSRFLRPPR